MNKKWWIIGGLIVVGAGVGAYFLFRPKKEEGGSDGQNNNNNESQNINSNTSSSSSSSIKCRGSYPSTPFSSNTEGNAFRLWVNTNFPAYAKEIDLDKTGEFNNCFIKKAYDKYGKVYSFSLVPTYIGKQAKLSSKGDYYYFSGKDFKTRFYSNGRVFIYDMSNNIIARGNYALGGRLINPTSGVKVNSIYSGSVWSNLRSWVDMNK